VRVIAGTARGRHLKQPGDNRIRPTADRVKEALFSILSSRIGSFSGLRVLDICAGTGNLGIEALSRGAAEAVFIDREHAATVLIRANLTALGFNDAATVLEMPAERALTRLQASGKSFDLIFFDPPYALSLPEMILPQVSTLGLASAQAIIVVEQQRNAILADTYGTLAKYDQRVYGDTALFFYAPAPPLTATTEH
jgi:16S rRNA (guanine(966)-N(2))-methyltransferase RsmD